MEGQTAVTGAVHCGDIERLRLFAAAVPSALERDILQIRHKALSGRRLVGKADRVIYSARREVIDLTLFYKIPHGRIIGVQEHFLLFFIDDLHGFQNGLIRIDNGSQRQAVHTHTAASFVQQCRTAADKISDRNVRFVIVEF